MKAIFRNTILASFILSLTIVTFSSCRKKKDTLAKIYVRDTANQPVSNCRVVLFGQSSEPGMQANVGLYDTSYTNTSGEAVFSFNDVYQLGQAGVAVLNIKATKNGLQGSGIIKIVEETTSEATVFLQD
jgi:hypothetical protein